MNSNLSQPQAIIARYIHSKCLDFIYCPKLKFFHQSDEKTNNSICLLDSELNLAWISSLFFISLNDWTSYIQAKGRSSHYFFMKIPLFEISLIKIPMWVLHVYKCIKNKFRSKSSGTELRFALFIFTLFYIINILNLISVAAPKYCCQIDTLVIMKFWII